MTAGARPGSAPTSLAVNPDLDARPETAGGSRARLVRSAKQIVLYSILAVAVFAGSRRIVTELGVGPGWGAWLTGLNTYLCGLVITGLALVVFLRPRMRGTPIAVLALGVGLVGLTLTCTVMSFHWVGKTFPGFFVMPNRVVPAAGLPGWTGIAAGDVYHHAVIEVNGQPVADPEEVYGLVRAKPPGTPIEYLFAVGEKQFRRDIPSMTFGVRDYFWLFVPYIMTGVLFAAAGLVVWMLKPSTAESFAMLGLGSCLGVFALTGTDLYGPYWFFRLHLSAEAFLPATLVHLALVFPRNYLRGSRRFLLTLPYGVALGLALAHQWFHFTPVTYSFIYRLCSMYLGVAALSLITSVVVSYWTTTSQLVRQRVRVLLVGTVAAAGPAVVLMGASGLSGGKVPVNATAFTSFLFPITLAYAIVKHDLFAIDAMVKRAAYYLALTGTMFVVYATLISVLDMTLRYEGLLGSIGSAFVLSLAVVVFFEPVKQRVRTVVETVCFRRVYDPEKVLQGTTQALASSPHLVRVLQILIQTIRRELQVTHGHVYLCGAGNALTLAWGSGGGERNRPRSIDSRDPVVQAVIEHPRAVSVYDVQESGERSSRGSEPDLFSVLDADLLVPLRFRGDLVGIVALGPKESGRFYTAVDVEFLKTLAAQSVVSILHAMAYRKVEELNRGLERKVEERTQELGKANSDLRTSLEERQQAYVELQRKQEQLVQAERMAALGRLTAGIAHEISTPLGAALSTLQVIEDLVREYRSAVDEPSTELEDHREMAAELAEVSSEAREWTEKAARFIRSIKLQGIGSGEMHEVDFRVDDVISETCQMLAHRLRQCQCSLQVSVDPNTPALFGDPARLGQVIANLLTNAVDAYRDAGRGGGEVRIHAGPGPDGVEISISDDAGGIAPEHLPRIFEELFTTKPRGLGTGLGLPISRNILNDCFGGRLDVDSQPGWETTFTVQLPLRHRRPGVDSQAEVVQL
jgi:signal transduction histidine kinase